MTEKNKDNRTTDNSEIQIDIPIGGSLGLLAYGDLGLQAWREVKRRAYQEMVKQQEMENQSETPNNTAND